MLYAQITPAAEKSIQLTPFSAITESADLMFAVARPYTLGAARVNFQVTFGNGTITDGKVSNFQELLSSNVNLSSDELSDQLLKQQYMNMSQEEVVALAGEEVAKRVEALNAQDKFNLAMEKVQDIVAKLIGGPFGSFVDMMADLANNSAVLYGTLTAMAGLSLAKLIMGLTTMLPLLTTEALAATTIGTVLSGGLALAGILTAIGLVTAALGAFSSDDAEPAGDMFSSNGKTIVSPKEGGLFSLSDNDEFAAAPGLGDMINRPRQQTAVVQDNSAVINAIALLNDTMKGVKDGVGQLYNKNTDIYMGPNKVGQSLTQNNYNLA